MTFAFLDNFGGGEMFVVAIVALLIFGKRLPEVAAQAGQALTKFRRGLDSAWSDTGMDHEIRKIKEAMPKDMSMGDVARLASRKMEQRLRELEKDELPSVRSSESVDPGAIEDASAMSAASGSGSEPTATDALQSNAVSSGADSTAEIALTATKGVDPAKHFGPPGSIPRE